MSDANSWPFSLVRRAGGLVFLSGEVPVADDGSIPEGITAQTELVFKHISETLAGEGLTLDDIVSCMVHLADKVDFAEYNEAYRKHFKDPLPVRTTVQAQMIADVRLEVTVVAAART